MTLGLAKQHERLARALIQSGIDPTRHPKEWRAQAQVAIAAQICMLAAQLPHNTWLQEVLAAHLPHSTWQQEVLAAHLPHSTWQQDVLVARLPHSICSSKSLLLICLTAAGTQRHVCP